MEIIERIENPLLERVEIAFRWSHQKECTPSLQQMVAAVMKAEPGSVRERIFVQSIETRFGQTSTTGTAYVYGSDEAASKEAGYLIERHARRGAHGAVESKQVESAPVEEAEPAEESEEEAAEESEDDEGEVE